MNSEALTLSRRVMNTIALGESHFREFKSALEGKPNNKVHRRAKKICEDIAEALVAFANADGGELIVGVEDDGEITGVPHGEEEVQMMLDAVQTHTYPDTTLPLNHSASLSLEGKLVLFFAVSKGTESVYQLSDGRCVKRKDRSTIPVSIRKIIIERQETKSREYDRQFIDGATATDLDLQLIQRLANTQFPGGQSVELYLQQFGMADYTQAGIRLRAAALLLFAKDSRKWHPRSSIRILKVAGTKLKSGEEYNVILDREIYGNIFELLRVSWEELRFFLAYKTEFGKDARFEQKYVYPENACREALVNAIAHRDYVAQAGIEIFIFDDRMEIKSPGKLLSTVSLESLRELQGTHESRNSLVARVLRENDIMRELGEGMQRIFQAMERSELQKPSIGVDDTSFSITLWNKSVFSSEQIQWLNVFREYELTQLQKKIVVCGMNGDLISPQDIYDAMNTDDRNTYDREVTGLRNAGLLSETMTNAQAAQYAKKNDVPKQRVPRFKVSIPSMTAVQEDAKLGVFVRNLPAEIDREQVQRIFESCGRVRDIKLSAPRFGEYRFATVYYVSSQAVTTAIEQLSGIEVDGRVIDVRKYIPRAY